MAVDLGPELRSRRPGRLRRPQAGPRRPVPLPDARRVPPDRHRPARCRSPSNPCTSSSATSKLAAISSESPTQRTVERGSYDSPPRDDSWRSVIRTQAHDAEEQIAAMLGSAPLRATPASARRPRRQAAENRPHAISAMTRTDDRPSARSSIGRGRPTASATCRSARPIASGRSSPISWRHLGGDTAAGGGGHSCAARMVHSPGFP